MPLQTHACASQLRSIAHLINWGRLLDNYPVQLAAGGRYLTQITADLGSYSHISVLKATMARSPCRKIPNESIRAPFSHPRLSVPGVGLDDTDVLVKDTAGIPAPPGAASATSPSWGSMLTPLTTSMGHRSWTKLNFKSRQGSFSHRLPVLSSNCWSANRYVKMDSLPWKMVAPSPFQARAHSPSGIHTAIAVSVMREVKPVHKKVARSCSWVLSSGVWLLSTP